MMMNGFKNLFKATLSNIKEGLIGKNKGLEFNKDNLLEYLPNIQKGTYYVIGGESGSGKTSFVDDVFVYSPLKNLIETNCDLNKISILYFSLEIDPVIKTAKFIGRRMFEKYKRELDINIILSRGNCKLSESFLSKIEEEEEFFEKLNSRIKYVTKGATPSGIKKEVEIYLKESGKIDENGKIDKDHYFIIIVDHLNLTKKETGLSKKESIDEISNYFVQIRNEIGVIPIVIQQLNRNMVSNSARLTKNMYEPKLADFKETGTTQEDANVVMAVFNPFIYKIAEYKGYDIKKYKDNYRFITFLKNRDGKNEGGVSFYYNGKIGLYTDIENKDNTLLN